MAKEGLLYGIDEYLEKNRKADVLSFTEVPEKNTRLMCIYLASKMSMEIIYTARMYQKNSYN